MDGDDCMAKDMIKNALWAVITRWLGNQCRALLVPDDSSFEVGNFSPHKATRSIADEGLLLLAEFEPSNGLRSNGLRSLCTVSNILEDGPPQANSGAWRVSLNKWHDILKNDIAYTEAFDITCEVLGEPLQSLAC